MDVPKTNNLFQIKIKTSNPGPGMNQTKSFAPKCARILEGSPNLSC